MANSFSITSISHDTDLWDEVAHWSIEQWGEDFPNDTAQTYVDLYAQSCASGNDLPKVYVAMCESSDGSASSVVGTVSLVHDDELPGALEPGPWLAALFVHPTQRGQGIGRQLVAHCVQEAWSRDFAQLWLYTPEHREWYEDLGWRFVRRATLGTHDVDVLTIHR